MGALSVTVQLAPDASLTETVPEGLIGTALDALTVTFAWTCCPTTAAVGLKMRVSVVAPLFTATDVVPELWLKSVFPLYVAVTASDALNDRGVRLHVPEPLTRLAVQLAPVLSLIATKPVGTPVPLTAGATVTDMATGTPNRAGFGEADAVTVVFSVKLTLTLCDATCPGGPGSDTETLKL
jgi:hypothetical protein